MSSLLKGTASVSRAFRGLLGLLQQGCLAASQPSLPEVSGARQPGWAERTHFGHPAVSHGPGVRLGSSPGTAQRQGCQIPKGEDASRAALPPHLQTQTKASLSSWGVLLGGGAPLQSCPWLCTPHFLGDSSMCGRSVGPTAQKCLPSTAPS